MTHERELTEPVDLCTPDGAALAPAARGWSRRPLHRANLHGQWGRNKRWDYWAVLAGDFVVSAVYSDVDYIGLADVWWADLVTGDTGGHGIAVPGGEGMSLPEQPGTAPLRVARDGLDLDISDDSVGTHIHATWTERDGRPGRLDVTVNLPPGHESLNVVIPWSDELFNFTSKHQARRAVGSLVIGDQRRIIGGTTGEAWGVLDVGRGRWPSEITWNWGGGAGRAGDLVIGLQVGGKWTEGTGFTENGVIVDGRLTKLGQELQWDYDWDNPLAPWRVDDPGGRLHAVLTPRFDKHTNLAGRKRGSEVHQVFGTWTGNLTTDAGSLDFSGIQGFAEERANVGECIAWRERKKERMARIGLVLGAGGAVGHAFHAGVLAALADETGWDARDAEVVVGTSAGSFVGAFLRAGLAPTDIAARAGDEPMSEEGRRLLERAEAATRHLPPIPARPPRRRGLSAMSAPGALVRAAARPWKARPGALAAAALPAGHISTEIIASGLRPLFDHWPERALWINAVQLHSSRRVTFGRDPSPPADVASAVAASCAIPSFFAPVTISGVRYVDGGVHSPTNADLVAGLGLDLVVISSPMSVARNQLRFAPDQPARRLSRFALAREAGRIRQGGSPLITFQPTPADLAVMGLNAMDPSRVADVTRQARESARDRLARTDARDRTAILTTSSPRPT